MKIKIKEFFEKRENCIAAAVFLITMLVACSPLITRYCINGHDTEYHLLRIESLKEGIMMGRPFLKVNALFFGGAGYASSMFYPDLLLYIPALLRCAGVSINASYHIFIAVCICLTYLSAYYCVGKITKNAYAAMLSGILLSLCQYHVDDIYIRGAAGEYTAFIFIPFVIYGLYNCLYENMSRPWLICIGYGGVLLCHTSSFVMCLVLGFLACIIKIRAFISNRRLFIKLIICAAVTACITLPYTLPMFEQLLDTTFKVSIPWNEPKFEAVAFAEIFYPVFPALGLAVFISLLPRVVIKKNQDNKDVIGFADCLIIAGSLFAVFATNLLPWDILGKYISFIQFPWRFFIMTSVLFAMAAGIILPEFIREISCNTKAASRLYTIIMLSVCTILFYTEQSGNTLGTYDYSGDYYTYKPYTAKVIGGEWLPVSVEDSEELVAASEHMYSDNGNELAFTRYKTDLYADILGDYEYADVPFVYYKGYRASITDNNGNSVLLNIDGKGKNGLSRVYLNGNQGRLMVEYKGTAVQKISLIISFAVILVLISLYVYKKRKKTENR